ncbi:MAG: fluoride efflux transporter FluC [Pseudomonadota bacterium]|jgi:CrcB protein
MSPGIGLQLAVVMAGGALGAAGRFLVGQWLMRHAEGGFPWGTLAVNLLGSLAAGFLLGALDERSPQVLWWRLFLMVGVLGGFTTYSALMVEVLLLARAPKPPLLAAYLGATLVGGLLLVWLGFRAGLLLRG